MKLMNLITLLGLGAMVSACANIETATRNAPFETTPAVTSASVDMMAFAATGPQAPAPQAALSAFHITQINVDVPQSLKVSEANRYYPSGDIVWREDPLGDRHAQVKAIFEDALQRGAATMTGGTPVILDVTVSRFHALTEKARYTVGGVHSIAFTMQLRDATTGAMIGAPHLVRADLKAFGGQHAIEAVARGETQKVRITAHLANVLQQELNAGGFENPKLGVMQAVNQL
ncbi:hypothetical protein JQX09_03985 [Sulfitobacter pseudonitzschiae]|uniref:Lipoprotein n=1 Tax=Pseudosulfitobacter pseudonitzschiae TaxID=1402135 RepID=A0A9Q2RW53_9RHOB|nr:DUF6778 family protein [Pseudosulfitobacter pseudonitzschiae]MBM2291053.1 hypothetical protein [Pseudosulfitobacter pseudonitzschiae]MBM2295971.1 hypothetical protein [Pseudosulfitobacter pseudonitzschiae]MBM2300884.1 hypothetical protein [Pseudosulfitobacter pseudonitzschiae]MBM2310668.1 hypothetical protein [Pseudosulfitobacter pseudonitzschiae]MBM2315581.1 hypothetical protein [Pseudosulfitobacter pseudonitzschiae]